MQSSLEITTGTVSVRMIGNAVTGERKRAWEAAPGKSVIEYAPPEAEDNPDVRILFNGLLLRRDEAERQVAAAGDVITFYWIPGEPASLVMMIIGMAISVGMTMVAAAIAPTLKDNKKDLDRSATYGWDATENTVTPGTPIPLIYGRHRMGGHILSQFQREARADPEEGDPRAGELHTLLALGAGPIQSVSSVRVNKNPYTDYGSTIEAEYRLGDLDQSPLDGFSDVVTQYAKDSALEGSKPPLTFTTQDVVDRFELIIRFPAGLYAVTSKGQFKQNDVEISVAYRVVGQTGWASIPLRTISGKTQSPFDAWIESPRLERAAYEILVTRRTPDEDSATAVSTCSVLAINEIQDEAMHAYPGISLLAVRQLPTNQVSGTPPSYDCLVEGRKVRVYTTTTAYTEQWSESPAWCLYDYMRDPEWGLGAYVNVEKTETIQSFIDWAAFCTTEGYTIGMVVDGSLSAIDVIQQMCIVGRATLFLRGDTWVVRVDKEEEPVQLLTMGRIHKGSFSVSRRSRADMPNVFTGQFWNAALDYEQDSLPREDPTLLEGDDQRDQVVNLLGVTNVQHAQKLLNYYMLSNRLLKRDVTLEVGTEMLAMEAGDVFRLAHDVPGWGFSGRLREVDDTGTTIVIDRDVTIEAGKSYELTVIHRATDTIDVVGVINNPGTTDRIYVSGDWTTLPTAGTDYSFGEVAQSTVLYRCIGITRSGDPTKRRIRAREYNAAIFGDDLTVLPTPSPSRLPDPRRFPADATDLRLVERQYYEEDGTLQTAIDVHFNLPAEAGIRAQVFWRGAGDSMWDLVGSPVSSGYLAIDRDVESPGASYEVSVVTISQTGNRKSADLGLRGTITTAGTTRQPSNVVGFTADRSPGGLIFRWDAVDPTTNFDLSHYEVRDGVEWDTAPLVGRTSSTMLETSVYISGARTFLLRAVNTAGKSSPASAVVVMTVSGRIGENVILTRQEETSWTGTKEGFTASGDDLLLDTTADIVAWRAGLTGAPARSSLIPGGYGASFRVSGSYTTAPFQVAATAVRCLISTDSVIDQVDLSLYWDALTDRTWDSDFARSRAWSVAPDSRVEARVEMRFSTTDSLDGSFGPWQERPQNIEAEVKWAQLRVLATIKDPSYTVRLTRLRIYFDVPDVTDSGTVTSSLSGTEAVTFAKTFMAAPKVAATVIGATAGDEVFLTSITTTGFNVEVKNAGSRVARTVHWISHGY